MDGIYGNVITVLQMWQHIFSMGMSMQMNCSRVHSVPIFWRIMINEYSLSMIEYFISVLNSGETAAECRFSEVPAVMVPDCQLFFSIKGFHVFCKELHFLRMNIEPAWSDITGYVWINRLQIPFYIVTSGISELSFSVWTVCFRSWERLFVDAIYFDFFSKLWNIISLVL